MFKKILIIFAALKLITQYNEVPVVSKSLNYINFTGITSDN